MAIAVIPNINAAETSTVNGNQQLLYVANDATGKIEIFDIDNGHKLIRSIDVPGNRYRGITAHAGTKRLYFTNAGDNASGKDDPNTHLIGAIDLTTDQVVWQFNPNESGCKKPDRLPQHHPILHRLLVQPA